jgi:hypothetical protein
MFKTKVHIRLDDIIHLVVERTLYIGLEKKTFVTTQINNQKDRQHNGKTKKRTNNDLQTLHRKPKIEQDESH